MVRTLNFIIGLVVGAALSVAVVTGVRALGFIKRDVIKAEL